MVAVQQVRTSAFPTGRRKGCGSARMIEISKRERFYQQEYCGCVYSLRDTNKHRVESGRARIQLGVKFYGDEESKDE